MVFIEKADIQITCSSAGNQRNKGIIFEFFQRTLPAGDCFVSTASDEDIMIAAKCGFSQRLSDFQRRGDHGDINKSFF